MPINGGKHTMTKEEFKTRYNGILARALAVNEKVRRYGIESLEENIDTEKCEKRDVFEYGLRLATDGKKTEEIGQILAEIVNKETDGDKKKLMAIQKDAILAIREGWNTRLVMLLINSHVSLDIHNVVTDELPEIVSLCPSPKDIEYKIYPCADGFAEILALEDDFVKKLMRELYSQELAAAIRHADKDLKNVFFRNMSEKAAEMLWEDIEYLGDVEPERAKECQQKIIDMAKALKAEEI
jgi:hypothetical protein